LGTVPTEKPPLKTDWSSSPESFQRFLAWLDEGVDSQGRRYVEMRRRLVSYFARKRCVASEDFADETLNRVARRLEEEGGITDTAPARYCYIVARFVFLESLRQPRAETNAHPGVFIQPAPEEPDAAPLADCLETCLQQLAAADRELILSYYTTEPRLKADQRRKLAASLGMTANALAIRACRIRDKLEACVNGCLSGR
jgi:DNA-directed RNA polymerase specialized sigma24 family protein